MAVVRGAQAAGGGEMTALLRDLFCRAFGRCTSASPTTKRLVQDMRIHARKADAETIDIRRKRESIADALREGQR